MGMSAWGFIITPILAASNPNIDDAQNLWTFLTRLRRWPA